MRRHRCPHCKEYGFFSGKLPREVIAVMGCRHCEELSVLFRDKVIPLDRRILESGTFDERKMHLAEVIAHFLEAGMFNYENEEREGVLNEGDHTPQEMKEAVSKRPAHPITDQEVDQFIKIDLHCLDNPIYFKRIFG